MELPCSVVVPRSYTQTFFVVDECGLHVRPASELVRIAVAYRATIAIVGDGGTADAKSILSLLLLGAVQGAELRVTVAGADAAEAMLALERARCLSTLHPSIQASRREANAAAD